MSALDIGRILAGLALLFVGFELVTTNLKKPAGSAIRRGISRWTRKPLSGFFVGMLIGAASQGTAMAVFLAAGVAGAGLVEVAVLIPVVLGANVGATVLAFIAALETGVLPLYVVAIAGIAATSDRLARFRGVAYVAFGLGVILLGIDFIKSGATARASRRQSYFSSPTPRWHSCF